MGIRNAKESDRSPVLEFCKDTFSWGDYIADVWGKWESTGGLYVYEQDGLVVGVYHVAFFTGEAWLEGMRVHPAHRKKGLGTEMMQHAESVIRTGPVRLVIESENHPSISLVTSVGYDLEEKWRLYSMAPQKQASRATVAVSSPSLYGLIISSTYADSWKWRSFDKNGFERLVRLGQVLVTTENEKVSAMGIWNRSRDFPHTFQLGFVNGTRDGMWEILRYVQNKAHEMNCERIQVFAPEKIPLDFDLLEKRSMFYLMKKELGKNL